MKKAKILFVILSLAIFTKSYSQSLEVGVQGMYNATGVIDPNNYGMHDGDYQFKYVGEFGIFGTFKFNKHIGVQIEVNTSSEGYSNASSPSFPFTRNVNLNYLQVPILLKYNTDGSVLRYYLMGGVQFGFLNSAKYNVDSASKTIISDASTNRYNSSDFGVVIATGLEVNFLPMLYANIGLRGNYGLTDINASAYKNSNGNSSNNYWYGLELGLHYKVF